MADFSAEKLVQGITAEQRKATLKLLLAQEAEDLKTIKNGFIAEIKAIFDKAKGEEIDIYQHDVYFIRPSDLKVPAKERKKSTAPKQNAYYYEIDGKHYTRTGREKVPELEGYSNEDLLAFKRADPQHPDFEKNKKKLEAEKQKALQKKKEPSKAPAETASKSAPKKK